MQNRWLSVINCTDSSKQLLHNFDAPFPPCKDRSTLFVQKISNISSKFKQCTFQDCENCNPQRTYIQTRCHLIVLNLLLKMGSTISPWEWPRNHVLSIRCHHLWLLNVITNQNHQTCSCRAIALMFSAATAAA